MGVGGVGGVPSIRLSEGRAPVALGRGGGGGRGQGRREANSRTGESPRRDGGRRSLPPSSLGRARGHERPRRPFDGEMQKTRDARGRR